MANPRRTLFPAPGNHHQLPVSTAVGGGDQSPATLVSSLKSFLKKPHAIPFLLSFFLLLTWVTLRFQRPLEHFPTMGLGSGMMMGRRRWSSDEDNSANVVRFSVSSPLVAKDKRGWLLNPISLALDSRISGYDTGSDLGSHSMGVTANVVGSSWAPSTSPGLLSYYNLLINYRVGLGCGGLNGEGISNFVGGATSCASIHVGEIKPGGVRGNHRHYTCNETFVIWGAHTLFRLENNAIQKGYAEVRVGADEVAVAASPSGTAHALVNIDTSQSTFFMGCQDSVVNYTDSKTDFNVWKDL